MFTIAMNINNEIIINKSRFICFLIKVYNEEDVRLNLENIKHNYKDATHYCYSYIIDNIKRFNDDGEPGGTAGMPILNALENNNLNYVLAVIVRYFGGIKLGTGGLVRAYSKSTSEAINKTTLNKLERGKNIIIKFNYDKLKIIDNILKDVVIINKIFDDIITYEFNIINNDYDNMIQNIKINSTKIKITDNLLIEKAINN